MPIPIKNISAKDFTETNKANFWKKVNKTDGCWEWTACKNWKGYGTINFSGTVWIANRASYAMTKGDIEPGLFVCHKCDNPGCVNPEHLFLGTNGDNVRDMVSKGRNYQAAITHCKHGHEYTVENTAIIDRGGKLKGRMQRICITCRRAKGAVVRAKARELAHKELSGNS